MAGIPLRQFGSSEARVSALGLGGHHLGDAEDFSAAQRIVDTAVDGGITFFDNCWEYQNGRAEDWMGRALQGKRDKVFLMTKACTHGRGKEVALRMLDESLRRLQTDHLDLWQLHGVAFEREPELYRTGDALEAMELARKQGKVRFLGFTGHKSPRLHRAMLDVHRFDAVQMPLNPFDAQYTLGSFEQQVLPEAAKRGMAVLGMKSLSGTAEPVKRKVASAAELLRYAMSLPGVTTTISGMNDLEVLKKNLALAQSFTPMNEDELVALRKRCSEPAGDARFEVYKASLKFDNPEARREHGFPLDAQQKELRQELDASQGKEEKHG